MPRILSYTLYPSYARASSSKFVPQRMHTGTYCVHCNDVGNIVFNMSLHHDVFLMLLLLPKDRYCYIEETS